MRKRVILVGWTLLIALFCDSFARAEPARLFALRVVDDATGRGVPLVELTAVDQQRWITDSHGYAAIDDPAYFGEKVFFTIHSHGYEFPADGFGIRGKAMDVTAGGEATIKLKRRNIAERLYRTTGVGIYAESVKLGKDVPLAKPVLNAQVAGSDSILAAVYRNRLFWFWGDTNRVSYPLGNFHTTGATSSLPTKQGLPPDQGINYEYFAAGNGFVKSVAKMPGEGPTWLGGIVVLRDEEDRERLYATYTKIRGSLEAYETGLCLWNDERHEFKKIVAFDKEFAKTHGQGHTFIHKESDGGEYVYFTKPLPLTRVKANAADLANPRAYEGYTCLQQGTRLKDKKLERDANGKLVYGWKADTPPLSQQEEKSLVRQGLLKSDEALLKLRDADTGREMIAHSGSVYYNEFRKRWLLITVEIGGESSLLGEVWLAEADTPLGPWAYARKIVTHDKYSFYNPKQHPYFDQQAGRVVYFEGTYTHTFSGNPEQTPRYDYNQVMYRIDLDDRRLHLPVAVYDRAKEDTPGDLTFTSGSGELTFFAHDRPLEGLVPIMSQVDDKQTPLFYVLPADQKQPPPTTTPLYAFVHKASGRRVYSVDGNWSAPDYEREPKAVGLVWKSPWTKFPAKSSP